MWSFNSVTQSRGVLRINTARLHLQGALLNTEGWTLGKLLMSSSCKKHMGLSLQTLFTNKVHLFSTQFVFATGTWGNPVSTLELQLWITPQVMYSFLSRFFLLRQFPCPRVGELGFIHALRSVFQGLLDELCGPGEWPMYIQTLIRHPSPQKSSDNTRNPIMSAQHI